MLKICKAICIVSSIDGSHILLVGLVLLAGCLSSTYGAESPVLSVCYNFGCKSKGLFHPTIEDIKTLQDQFKEVDSAREERARIRLAIATLEQIAARYLPTGNDVGGNYTEGMVDEGKQDCIDESTNTTTYLSFLAQQGWLHWHSVEARVHRSPYLFDDHWAAQIRQRDTQQSYVVDSWMYDNGRPPIIESLQDWQNKRDIDDQ